MKLYMKMRHCALLALASFALVALAAADELKIDVVHKPESCEQQAANGDYVHVHYTVGYCAVAKQETLLPFRRHADDRCVVSTGQAV